MAPLKIIGAGFGRTGTLSLCHALETLGFKCHHMENMILDPTQDPDLFAQAYASRTADWDYIFRNYDAAVDWPAAAFWPELITKYPDAKVILTVRDPESWYKSVGNTIQDWPMDPNAVWPERLLKARRMARTIVREGELRNFADKDTMLAQFEANIALAKKLVPADRLLIFRVSEGWAPLCDFLGAEVPQGQPFPRSNKGEDFVNRLTWVSECIQNQDNNVPIRAFEPDRKAMQPVAAPVAEPAVSGTLESLTRDMRNKIRARRQSSHKAAAPVFF